MGQKLYYMVVELVQVKAITFFFLIQDGHRDLPGLCYWVI